MPRARRSAARSGSPSSRSVTPPPAVVSPAFERAVAALVVAIVIALFWYFWRHAGGLWRDEASSVATQKVATLAGMYRFAEFESFPFLWMMLLRAWIWIGGDSDAWLRVFGVLCGLSVPGALWFTARRLGARVPVLALALVAANVDVVRWGSIVRPWGLGAALAVVATAGIWQLSVAPTRRRLWFAVIAAVLAVQCTYQNAVFVAAAIAASGVVLAARRLWTRVPIVIAVGGVAALSLVPYVGVIGRRSQWNMLGQGDLTLAQLIGRLTDALGANGAVALVAWIVCAAGAVGVVLAGLKVRRSAGLKPGGYSSAETDLGIHAGLTLVFSTVALLAFYLQFRYLTQPWYYIGLFAVAALAIEIATASLRRLRFWRPVQLAIALAVAVSGVVVARQSLGLPQTNLDALAERLNGAAAPGDLILVNPWFLGPTVSRYYHGVAAIDSVPPLEDRAITRYDLFKAQMHAPDGLAAVLSRAESVLRAGHQIWIVGAIEAAPDGAQVPPFLAAPRPDTGWNAEPYERWYSLSTGTFLRSHVLSARSVDVDVRGMPLEDARLTVLSGWRQ